MKKPVSFGGGHKCGHSAGFSVGVHAGQDGCAFAEDQAGGWAFEGVGVLDAGGGDAGADGGQVEGLVVEGRAAVLGRQFGDDKEDTGLFEIAVRQSVGPQQLRPPHFKPDGIDRMMHHAGLVGLDIPRHDLNRAFLHRRPRRKRRLGVHLVFLCSGLYPHGMVSKVSLLERKGGVLIINWLVHLMLRNNFT